MSFGQVRDRLPRAVLTLPGRSGPFDVEFVVDTGFDGGLTLPPSEVRRLDASPSGTRSVALANGSIVQTPYYEVIVEGASGEQETEILVLDGNPLLGVELMEDCLLQVSLEPGGEVTLDPL